ncbi:unnamed protein product [Calypogeia fissa]
MLNWVDDDDDCRNQNMMMIMGDLSIPAQKRWPPSEAPGQQLLLPGILNEITLNRIVPKLEAKVFSVLKKVSHGWYNAIRTRQVYDARVRAHSTEAFIIFDHFKAFIETQRSYKTFKAVSLYSVKEKVIHELPPIPNVSGGIPISCQCVSLEGKIYVLGGRVGRRICKGSKKVYVLDMVEEICWKECASMKEPREEFGCGVLDGKIYVFGGFYGIEPVSGSEVYDPKQNTWTSIMPMNSVRFAHLVGVMGDEFLLHTGKVDRAGYFKKHLLPNIDYGPPYCFDWASGLEFYHPVKDEWRVLTESRRPQGIGFIAQGKLYSLNENGIYVCDVASNSWRILHSCSFPAFGLEPDIKVTPLAVVVVTEDEILVLVNVGDEDLDGQCLVRGKGLGIESMVEILFQPACLESAKWPVGQLRYCMYPLQL